MALPRLDKPIIPVVMPSNKKSVSFRPMTRREEKLLLQAKESKDPLAWVDAVRQVVTNCAVDTIDVDAMASFDMEYAFVKIRAASIGSRETLSYRDAADGKLYDVEVNLDEVTVVFPPSVTDGVITVADGAKMKMKWPSALAWGDPEVVRAQDPEDALDALIAYCIERIWVGEETYDVASSPREEVLNFIESLDVTAWHGIREWATQVPHLSYWVEWENSLGDKRRVELRTLTDFFTFSSTDET